MIRRYSRHSFLFLISLGKSLILEGVKFFPLAAFSSLSSRATTQVGFRSETAQQRLLLPLSCLQYRSPLSFVNQAQWPFCHCSLFSCYCRGRLTRCQTPCVVRILPRQRPLRQHGKALLMTERYQLLLLLSAPTAQGIRRL